MKLLHKGIDVFYQDEGQGLCTVLLHGFLEDQSMWDDLSTELIKNGRVIRVDLLGHGNTGNIGYIHTMKDMAQAVVSILRHLDIEKFVLIGHSMGGYVALEIAAMERDAIRGLCLMNSTYRADSDERKLLRKRAVDMAKENFAALVRMSFVNLFSEESRMTYSEEIEQAMLVALNTSNQGYVAAQKGMMVRNDFFDFFKQLEVPKMILLGKKDGLIEYQTMIEECVDGKVEMVLLSEGHMGHIENKYELTYNLMRFIEKL